MQDDASDMLPFLLKYQEMVEIEPKAYFVAHFEFFVYTLSHPMSYTPRFLPNERPY